MIAPYTCFFLQGVYLVSASTPLDERCSPLQLFIGVSLRKNIVEYGIQLLCKIQRIGCCIIAIVKSKQCFDIIHADAVVIADFNQLSLGDCRGFAAK